MNPREVDKVSLELMKLGEDIDIVRDENRIVASTPNFLIAVAEQSINDSHIARFGWEVGYFAIQCLYGNQMPLIDDKTKKEIESIVTSFHSRSKITLGLRHSIEIGNSYLLSITQRENLVEYSKMILRTHSDTKVTIGFIIGEVYADFIGNAIGTAKKRNNPYIL